MDKSWMYLPNKLCQQYKDGVKSFIEIAKNHVDGNNKSRCPCRDCQNAYFYDLMTIESHLLSRGMAYSYTCWVNHGEEVNIARHFPSTQAPEFVENEEEDDLVGMLNDMVGPNSFPDHTENAQNDTERGTRIFDRLFGELEQELYPGCKKYGSFQFLIKLMHVKVLNRWSNKSFDMLLQLLKDAFPDGSKIPTSHYEAKQKMRDLGLGYESIHVCKYDCALFWKENQNVDKCPICDEPRYKYDDKKGKNIPHKVLRYFPLKPRLQRLFMSRHTAADMRWHKEKRIDTEDVLRHPADAEAWKDFDKQYPWFAQDSRNVRLGLASDGFNPFGNMSNSYSMWPVVLVPYNFPPWKCMKEPFFMMSLLIPGPQAPGKDMDVYLRPLIDELKELWDVGVQIWDVYGKEYFRLHACVLWTINDFPAYGSLSGWSTKGYNACPVCNEDTSSQRLRNKICYMGHRRYLPSNHSWRRSRLHDGKHELRPAPRKFNGDDILEQLGRVKTLKPGKNPNNKDKKRKRTPEELNWSKKSIFFELEYWSKLKLRHNLDVMHIEKNICDNVLGTLMNIEGKTKDTDKARLDLADMKIRKELHLEERGNRLLKPHASKDTDKARLDLADMKIRKELHLEERGNRLLKPHASYTLTVDERKNFCAFLNSVKFPDGYAANISRNVSIKDGKISGLKSHDCHVMLQRLIPVGIRRYLPKDVCTALVELSSFFQQLCAKTLSTKDLEKLEEAIVLILCKLERIFPPAFFDVMVHLAVHLPREAILAGPVNSRWMFPFERNLGTLKHSVKNKARPEGSIAETYIVNEALTFCSMYLRDIETKFNREERNDDARLQKCNGELSVFSQVVRPLGGGQSTQLPQEIIDKIHWYILNNCKEMQPYLDEHKTQLEIECPNNLDQRQECEFPQWFADRMKTLRHQGLVEATDELYSLACGPDVRVNLYSGCVVNGVRFHTKERDERRTTQNSGVVVPGANDGEMIEFYGRLCNVMQMKYLNQYNVVIFKCDWFDTNPKKKRIQRDYHFTSINVSCTWYENDPFVLATQASQVFYLDDYKSGPNWKVVQKVQHRHIWDVSEEDDMEDTIDGIIGDAYQEGQSSDVQLFVQEQVLDLEQFVRADVQPDIITTNDMQDHDDNDDDDDDDDGDNGGTEDEDDTLAEYCSDDEENQSDNDDSD